ncbi:hypothetical protein KKC97_10390 [bacterium]|nr:hypothetical protein [bacterium]MBU1638060.1 hypothetical protein [bacterium]MBU1920640.1 hypothetical protein [bacterium]
MRNWPKNQQRERVQLGIKIQVDAVAMQKLWLWADMAKGEFSCLGLVDDIRDANTGAVTALIVTDFILIKQQSSSDETELDPAAVAELLMELETQGIDGNKLRCWCHSHGDLSVFFSGQDDRCIEGLANGEWLLSLVVNKQRDSMIRLDQFHPCHLYVSDCVFDVVYPQVDGLAEACLTEFKAKVRESQNVFCRARRNAADRVQDLKIAQERGALTMDELQDEIDWMGFDYDELETPF